MCNLIECFIYTKQRKNKTKCVKHRNELLLEIFLNLISKCNLIAASTGKVKAVAFAKRSSF